MRLFEDRFLVLKFHAFKFRFVATVIGLPVVVQSKDHGFEIVAVNIALEDGVSSGFESSLQEISITLNLSLKLITLILSVFHDCQRHIGIFLYFDILQQPNLTGFFQLVYQSLPKL